MDVNEYAHEFALDINHICLDYGLMIVQAKMKLCALYVMNEMICVMCTL